MKLKVVDSSINAVALTHPFKDKLPNVDEFFQAENEVGCINTVNVFCNRNKQLAEKYKSIIDESKFKGDMLELLVEYIMLTMAHDNRIGIYDYKPVVVDEDVGVDGHGIGENGHPATVQAKFRRGDYTLTANEDHLSNFVTASQNDFRVPIEDAKNMLLITTGKDVQAWTLENMLKNKVRVLNREALREMLDNRPEWWIRFYESVKASRVKPANAPAIVLRQHQEEAVLSCLEEVARGKCILPTGTGKTFIEDEVILRTIREIQSKGECPVIKVNASRILLCFQLFEETFAYLSANGVVARYANYNSGNPSDAKYAEEMRKLGWVYREIISTTSPREMAEFAKKAKEENLPLIVFSTYHSAEKFASSKLVPHLTIHDEAHNLVSNEFHKCAMLPSLKDLFFTATEKVTDSSDDMGMNKAEVFGEMLYTKSPKEMIDRGEMIPPRVHVVREKAGSKINLDKLDKDYDALINSIFDAFNAHQKKLVEMSFDPSQIGAKVLVVCRGQLDLMEMFKTKVFEGFTKKHPEIHLYALSSDFGIYNSDNVGEERADPPVTNVKKFKLLQDVKKLTPSDKAIIFHVDMIGEGIDVSGITGVMPFRNCELVKFIQNIGRASRLNTVDRKRVYAGLLKPNDTDRNGNKWIKPYSWVIIPSFLENSDGFCGRFREIINAMRSEFGYVPRQHTVVDNVRGEDDDDDIDTVNDKTKNRPNENSKSGAVEFEHQFEQMGQIERMIFDDEVSKEIDNQTDVLSKLIS